MKIIKGKGAPTIDTVGDEGDLYVNIAGKSVYECTGTDNPGRDLGFVITYHDHDNAYVWEPAKVDTFNKVTFMDYDGTILYSYTIEEANALTELPPYPEHNGLICQGWNYSLESVQNTEYPLNVGAMYTTDDGKTRIYVTLPEGRTSPILSCCPNGTVTVDWGDGTEPDVLTGDSVSDLVSTPKHEYASAGDYIITLTVDGELGFYGNNSSSLLLGKPYDTVGYDPYLSTITRIEIGDNVINIDYNAFDSCFALKYITIPNSVTSFSEYIFRDCLSLVSVVLPDSTNIIGEEAFEHCYSLSSISIPNSVTEICTDAFMDCSSLKSVVIPGSVVYIMYNAFECCYNLTTVFIHPGVTKIYDCAFEQCKSLSYIYIPDTIDKIYCESFYNAYLLKTITIPGNIKSIDEYTFYNCTSMLYYDFTSHTSVPILYETVAFGGIPDDCEILVPAALYDEWVNATNWVKYADHIVAV